METILVVLIVMGLVLFAIPTLTNAALSAHDAVAEDWRVMEAAVTLRADTSLAITDVQAQNNTVDLTIRNQGNARLADFEAWDLILEYYASPSAYRIAWIPYITQAAPSYWWQVQGIYLDVDAGLGEAFERGILNPGEEMVLRVTVNPACRPGAGAQVTVSTPNGVAASTVFVCQ